MAIEVYRLDIGRRRIAIVESVESPREGAIKQALQGLGASQMAGRVWSLPDSVGEASLRDALGMLEEGDCVTLLAADAGALSAMLFVPPRNGHTTELP